ncbi:MAG TPA: DUF2911 domain-containing protein [Cyclobacteriaceae bacterium]
MKKKIFIGLGVLAVALVAFFLYAALVVAKRSPIKTETASNNGLEIKVVYCQPYKKGRLIFGEEKDKALQPYGKYWRLGANAATEITFNKNVNFAGKPVNAGTYRMYAIPGATSWQVALNSELGVYFAINEPNYALDVVRVEVPAGTAPAETEQFVINFSNDSTTTNMDFVWDKTLIRVPITPQ